MVGHRDENLNSCTLNSAGDGCASATGDCVYAAGIASSDVCVANPGFSEEETVVGDGGDAVRDWEPGRDSRGAAVGDLDGDGTLDLYVANDGSENELLLNDGSGRFSSVAGGDATAATGRSMDAVAVDLDGDSDLDLYVLNVGNNELLINNGAAEFSSVGSGDAVATDRDSRAALVGDFDGYGGPDLYVINYNARNEL